MLQDLDQRADVADARQLVKDPVGQRDAPLGLALAHAPGQPPETTLSATDGTFEFQAGRGSVTLTATAPALPAVRARVELQDVERQAVTLRLSATLHTLRGRVFDMDELPVAGATLRLESMSARFPHHRVVVAADDGAFEITGLPPPPYRIVVSHEELADEELDVTSTEDELAVVLLPAGTLRGSVVDDLGPAADVEVVLFRDGRLLSAAPLPSG